MRADDSPRNAARAGRARRYTSWVRSSASARSPSRAHTRHTSGWVRRTNAVVATRSPVPAARASCVSSSTPRPRDSVAAGNQPAQSGDLPCHAMRHHPRGALGPARRRGSRASTTTTIDAHLDTCEACAAWSEELATLHRMVRVREAEVVPDLTRRDPRHRAGARAPPAHRSAR